MMPLHYRFLIKNPSAPWLQGDTPRQVLTRHHGMAVETLLTEAEGLAKGYTPVDRGTARAAIATQVVRGYSASVMVRGRLFGRANAPHLPYLEHGTRPHWPPIDAIRRWARRKLHDENAAFAVARAISRRGTPAHRMFARAWAVIEPKVGPMLRVAHQSAVKELRG